jgi:glycosyltransferase involved in cell wall biosynthesis
VLRRTRFFADVEGLEESASRFPARVFGPLSIRIGWPRVRAPFDALLATNFLPPHTTRRGVVLVVHDLAFDRFPETAPHHDARWRRLFDGWLAKGDGVIVPSNATRDDLATFHGVEPGRVDVVPLGVDPFDAPDPRAAAAARGRIGVGARPYALFVGGLEARKNLEALVRGFARTLAGDLVLAGGGVNWDPGYVARLDDAIGALAPAVRARIHRVGYVDDVTKTALLEGASLVVYPSLAEGFGLPVLEAFAAGVPVLTSSASSLPEVAGDAALLVTPDEDGIAEGLERLWDDAALRTSLAQAGRSRAHAFTWASCARRTAEVLHRAAERAR